MRNRDIRGTDHEAPSVTVGRGTAGWIRPARSGDSWPSGDHLIAGRDEAAELVARDCVRDDGRPGPVVAAGYLRPKREEP